MTTLRNLGARVLRALKPKPLVCVWCNQQLTGLDRHWCHDCREEWT
jgi:hypothetical protein